MDRLHKNVEAVAQATADLYRELEQEWHDLDRMREEAIAWRKTKSNSACAAAMKPPHYSGSTFKQS